MLIKATKNWKDLAESGPGHKPGMTRREFMERGIATGFLTVGLSNFVLEKAIAAGPANCPAPVRAPGVIAQIYAEGGSSIGARWVSDAQAASMNASMAANYGQVGAADMVRLGQNFNVGGTTVFGRALMEGPPGYPGGAAAWRANVLSKVSGGGHLGPFNQDDGAGQNRGYLGRVSPFKKSDMGKDLAFTNNRTLAAWANGLPSAGVQRTVQSLASSFSLTPAANGLTNTNAMNAASDGANNLVSAMAPTFKSDSRKGASAINTNAACAFYGNSALADPAYGTALFTPAQIPALTAKATVGQLTAAEQAQLTAFYQSAMGVAGGVTLQVNGRDYHGQNPQNNIGPRILEEARAVMNFLLACDASGQRGVLLYVSNGQAISSGVTQVNLGVNGTNLDMQCATAKGDAGGSYNGVLALFYNPAGAGPAARFTGTINTTNGNVKSDPSVSADRDAFAGAYLSALAWVNNGVVPQAAIDKMKSAGVNAGSSIMFI
jgi:hypothetical protein